MKYDEWETWEMTVSVLIAMASLQHKKTSIHQRDTISHHQYKLCTFELYFNSTKGNPRSQSRSQNLSVNNIANLKGNEIQFTQYTSSSNNYQYCNYLIRQCLLPRISIYSKPIHRKPRQSRE